MFQDLMESIGPGAVIAFGLFLVFAAADGYVSDGFRRWLSGHLVSLTVPKSNNRWPTTFIILFRRVFGKKALSWKFFGRSCIASLLGVVVMTVVWETVAFIPCILVSGIVSLIG